MQDRELNLRIGETVVVRSRAEILATLDGRGELNALPFMPEMLQFCGRRFTVYRRAGKFCDTKDWTGMHRLDATVHLEGLRCDGQAHGGCQAGCLLYWREDWLRRVDQPTTEAAEAEQAGRGEAALVAATRADGGDAEPGRERWSYCGTHARVLRRVERIIDEPTGQMLRFDSDCIVLEGVVCTARYHQYCPRSIPSYWREIWLERV
jgi:hypothetical protein